MKFRILASILVTAALFSAFSFAGRSHRSEADRASSTSVQIVHKAVWENI